MESSLNPWGQDTHTRKSTIPRNVNDVKGFGLEKITKMLKEVILIFALRLTFFVLMLVKTMNLLHLLFKFLLLTKLFCMWFDLNIFQFNSF